MFKLCGIFVLLLGITLHAQAALIKDCFAKYGAPRTVSFSTPALSIAKYGCAMFCDNPDLVRPIIANQGLTVAEYESACQQLLDADNTIIPATSTVATEIVSATTPAPSANDCYGQYGAPRTLSLSSASLVDIGKWGCAKYCEDPELVKPSIAARGYTIAQYESACELLKGL